MACLLNRQFLRRMATKLPQAGSGRNPLEIIKKEFQAFGKKTEFGEKQIVPVESDYVIIGGGIMGCAIAYWAKKRNPKAITVTVVERDPNYTRASTVLSVGGLRTQFSVKENIQMSLFTAEFLRDIRQYLSVLDLDPPDVQFNPQGYLFLARPEGEEAMRVSHETQKECGAKVELMTPEQLERKFSWLNTEGIALGSYGLEYEGWFDPWSLLTAFKAKAISLGVRFVKGEVIGFDSTEEKMQTLRGKIYNREILTHVNVKTDEDLIHPIKFHTVYNAAGPWAGEIARMAKIGTGSGALSIALPVEPRKRYVYVFHCPDGPGLDMPMLCDSSGVYVRREGLGGHYICGASPKPDEEPSTENLNVDYEFFNNTIWPVLAERVPAFKRLKVKNAWAGFYDYNTYDQNLIFGNHPYHTNFFFVNGLSGHGIQHACAIGRAIDEQLHDHGFKTIDFERFSFDRIVDEVKIIENAIV